MNYIYIMFLSVVFLVTGCSTQENTEEIPETQSDLVFISKEQWKDQNMELASVSTQPFNKIIRLNGEVDIPPKSRAIVSVKKEGYIKNMEWIEGDYVSKGQLLFQIENLELVKIQQQFLETHEQLKYLENEYDRQRKMLEDKTTAQKNYLKVESEFKTTQATYLGLKKQLTELNFSISKIIAGEFTSSFSIYSPISGYITKVNAVKGMFVSQATPVIEIVNNNHLHVELFAYEKDINQLNIGQKVNILPPGKPTDIIEGKIHQIGKVIDEDRRVKVHVHVDEAQKKLIAGMFIEAEIIISSYNSQALPFSAVVEENDKQYALKLVEQKNDGYYFKVESLKTGSIYNNYIEILDDKLDTSSQFLKKGGYELITF